MATKHTDKCLEKAADDEPIFVLRAQDRFAPSIVRVWIEMFIEHHGGKDKMTVKQKMKMTEATVLAVKMEQWPTRKYPD